MFNQSNCDVVFFETVKDLKKQKHTFIECIPLSRNMGMEAPLYFKKAILESESEWQQHKKIISTAGKVEQKRERERERESVCVCVCV